MEFYIKRFVKKSSYPTISGFGLCIKQGDYYFLISWSSRYSILKTRLKDNLSFFEEARISDKWRVPDGEYFMEDYEEVVK